jgi:hypothetical protein
MYAPAVLAKAAERRRLYVVDASAERFEGYSLMALPLSTGHVLAFHRRATSSIGPPFSSVWHRDPEGRWTFHADVVPSRSCLRYFGPAVHEVREGAIDVVWKSRFDLSVYVHAARLHMALRLCASRATRLVTAASHIVPGPLWQHDGALAAIGGAAGRALGAGAVPLSGRAPAGHAFRLHPRALWRVEAAAVVHDGRDLGEVSELCERVALADYTIPRCALFSVGTTEFRAMTV